MERKRKGRESGEEKRKKWEEVEEETKERKRIGGPRSVQSSPIEDALGNCTVIMPEWNRGRDAKDGKECRR